MKALDVIDLGTALYQEAYALQKEILSRKKSGELRDYLIIVEHPNVLTIGRSGSQGSILIGRRALAAENIDVVYTDRGGDATFHGPGQVVAYPIIDLRHYFKDVRRFIDGIEAVISMTLRAYGIGPDKRPGRTGIWEDGGKVGFIGVGLSGWITYHGFSINANVDLRYFSMIKPCGIEGAAVTSMEKALGRRVDIAGLKLAVAKNFCEVFNFEQRSGKEDAGMAFAADPCFRIRQTAERLPEKDVGGNSMRQQPMPEYGRMPFRRQC